MRYPGFLPGLSGHASAYMADSEELINFYFEKTESPNAPTPGALLPTPGFATLGSVPEGPGRGSCVANGLTFFVAGYKLYQWDGVTATSLGTVASDTNPSTLSWNGPAGGQLFITSGDVGYNYDLTSQVLSTVLSSGATMGAFLDGYFLALDAATGTLQLSDLLDGTVWDPTQIAQRTGGPDPWVAMTVVHSEIWLMGARTSEIWFNAGAFPFPFERIQGAVFEDGIAAPFSLSRNVAPLFWVAQNEKGARRVLMAQGYAGQRVSTYALEHAMQAYATVDDALSMSFQVGGHTFYALVFPKADQSWMYDVGEGEWFKWLFWNTLTSAWEAVRVRTHVLTPGGIHFMQDRTSGSFYRMSLDLFTDVDGSLILRERTPPILSMPDHVRFIVDQLELIMDVGVGLLGSGDTDPSVNPQAMLQTSRDGGRTWGTERVQPIGKVGHYTDRVYWTNGGQARNRQDRFRFAAACPIRIVDATVTVRQGTS